MDDCCRRIWQETTNYEQRRQSILPAMRLGGASKAMLHVFYFLPHEVDDLAETQHGL